MFCICKTLFKYWPELSKIVPSTADDPGNGSPGNGSPGKDVPRDAIPVPPPIHLFGRSRSETLAINAFAHVLHEKGYDWRDLVTGYRPNFLINPKTGKPMEIDVFHPGLKIGVEYNGIQHYEFPNRFHEDTAEGRKAFEEGLARDQLKAKLCADHGINLIDIPHYVDTCIMRDNKYVYKKNSDAEKWECLKRYLDERLAGLVRVEI